MKSKVSSIIASIRSMVYTRYIVSSLTNPKTKYVIERSFGYYVCSCPDQRIRGGECKHIRQIKTGTYPSRVYA